MARADRTEWPLILGLSALAGYVDAAGFLKSGGYFVSMMSGNVTRLGVDLGGAAAVAWIPFAIIVIFVLGVVIGSLVGRFAKGARRETVLTLTSALLAAAAGLGMFATAATSIAVMTLAMGAVNAVFEQEDLSDARTARTNGLPSQAGYGFEGVGNGHSWLSWQITVVVFIGFVAGAFAGSIAYQNYGLGGLWIASGVAALFAVLVNRNPGR